MADVIEENDLKAKFETQGLNLYQGITLASIVQKEANNAADQAKVAQVFYNRLAQGMSLGSDVTTQYAVDLVDPDRQIYTNNAEALQIDSPIILGCMLAYLMARFLTPAHRRSKPPLPLMARPQTTYSS